jgi:mercuric ion binding protein
MKVLSIFAVLFSFICFSNNAFAQTTLKEETIKVWGNCGMCKETIETAATKAGATTAVWNEESKELKVTFASNKTDAKKIQQKIANSGYDTQDFSAPDKVYNKLHGCCKYERKATVADACCSNKTCGTAADSCKTDNCCKDKSCCKS